MATADSPGAQSAELAQRGYAVLHGAFPPGLCDELTADASRYVITPPNRRAGGAFAMTSLTRAGAPARAAAWITDLTARVGLTEPFAPNEASYQRYEPNGNGLPPHRDQRYYATCIAIVTLTGSARFAIHAGPGSDDIIDQWTTSARDVILLRGWTPASNADPRPYHRIDPPGASPRLMFQVRHNLAASGRPDWATGLTDAEANQARNLARTPEAPRT
ncbi:hypothetical protein TPB0596_32550 [Tsukamurella pulmonis]|uniref:hypothetical protein n=1 Tax=Tsukamurella pulmonis TaxID=47312 RepID=UPI001EE13228|nr:hypothetical protein [Tsukamurella pulmonis]BDD83492.1 hypothetical protein TPB0596_32550 [Tsukamurella pulmonis]